jgi:hypothetical protein
MVIYGDLICLLGHEDVDDVHYDLADDLDLLFLKEDGIGLLKDKLVAQLLKILNHAKQLLVLVKDESMELVLSNGVQNTQQDKRGYRNDLKILTFFVERLQDILRELLLLNSVFNVGILQKGLEVVSNLWENLCEEFPHVKVLFGEDLEFATVSRLVSFNIAKFIR